MKTISHRNSPRCGSYNIDKTTITVWQNIHKNEKIGYSSLWFQMATRQSSYDRYANNDNDAQYRKKWSGLRIRIRHTARLW